MVIVMAMDELTMLSFIGLYILFLGTFVYNFYLSKKIYKLLENIGEVITLTADIPTKSKGKKKPPRGGTMKRLIREGMALEGTAEGSDH
jgi:hypothetical protein